MNPIEDNFEDLDPDKIEDLVWESEQEEKDNLTQFED
jgi:hypothetical protein